MMSKPVWDKIWENDGYSMPELRILKANKKLELVYHQIDISSDQTVIDIGCGGGYISKQLYMDKGCNIIGVDISQKAIDIAERLCVDLPIKFIHSSATSLNLNDNTADIILCIGVIEHIKETCEAINEIRRVLKPGGIVFISSSNKYSSMYYHRRIKEILGVWKYGYQRNWTPRSLEKLMESSGFITINLSAVEGIQDFPTLTMFDKLISIVFRKWGRYILYTGSTKK